MLIGFEGPSAPVPFSGRETNVTKVLRCSGRAVAAEAGVASGERRQRAIEGEALEASACGMLLLLEFSYLACGFALSSGRQEEVSTRASSVLPWELVGVAVGCTRALPGSTDERG